MLLFGLILSGTDARAGAWPREQGSGFVSITSQLAWPRDMLLNGTAGSPEEYQTVYLEYGLTPRLIVLHYTAMESAEAALERLCDPEAEVSAHYLISCRGEITRMVPEENRAWHAGAGQWVPVCQ